jgi:hypothetical protein
MSNITQFQISNVLITTQSGKFSGKDDGLISVETPGNSGYVVVDATSNEGMGYSIQTESQRVEFPIVCARDSNLFKFLSSVAKNIDNASNNEVQSRYMFIKHGGIHGISGLGYANKVTGWVVVKESTDKSSTNTTNEEAAFVTFTIKGQLLGQNRDIPVFAPSN